MPSTLSTLTADFKRVFQDATSTQCERAVNLAHRDFLEKIPEAARNMTGLDLDPPDPPPNPDIEQENGKSRYPLPANCAHVMSVLRLTTASAGTWMHPTTRDQLDLEMRSSSTPWPLETGTPTRYFVEADVSDSTKSVLMLNLYPIPTADAAAGFPAYRIYYTEAKTLVSADTIPEGLASERFYRNRALAYLSDELKPERSAMYWQLSMEALETAIAQFKRLPAPQGVKRG